MPGGQRLKPEQWGFRRHALSLSITLEFGSAQQAFFQHKKTEPIKLKFVLIQNISPNKFFPPSFVRHIDKYDSDQLFIKNMNTNPAFPKNNKGKPALKFTNREADVLSLLIYGLTNKEIGRQLGISDHTVRDHISSILKKTNMTSRVELAVLSSTMKRPL